MIMSLWTSFLAHPVHTDHATSLTIGRIGPRLLMDKPTPGTGVYI